MNEVDRLPTVSIALCTRNGERYVAEQLRSILGQRPAPLEVVVGDDASTDSTVAVIEATFTEARAENPGLGTRLVIRRHEPPLGVVANFADAIAACRGDLVALSDQDDRWASGKLARIVPLFATRPELRLVHSDARLVDAGGIPLGLTVLEALEATTEEREGLRSGDAFAVLLRRNLVTGATVVFRRELAAAATPFPQEWVHDEWLAVLAAGLDPEPGGLRLVAEPLIDYRQHDGNEIGARRPTMAHRWAKLREPRDGRAPLLALRTRQLADRLRDLGAPADRVEQAESKHRHEAARAALPRFPLWRVPHIVAAALSGRYARYSRGSIDVLRDLVQPAGRKSR